MSSPVATVPPDAHLKDVAAILVEHGINAAPLVDTATGYSRSARFTG